MADTRIFLLIAAIALFLSLAIPSLGDHTLSSVFFPHAFQLVGRKLTSFLPSGLALIISPAFTCKPHSYRTEIVSTDPLVIYFHDFLASYEIPVLLDTAEPLFRDSLLTNNDGKVQASRRRTSRTAVLPITDTVVESVLGRATEIMGGMFDVTHDDFQPPQLARYTTGQHFDVHADWFDVPQERRLDSTGNGSTWNRQASFFAILQDDCTGRETWFPHLKPPGLVNSPSAAISRSRIWREHEDAGLAFRPVRGGALFWVNLFANGTGDDRTRHAGLPVLSGVKTGMNLWPRVYYS